MVNARVVKPIEILQSIKDYLIILTGLMITKALVAHDDAQVLWNSSTISSVSEVQSKNQMPKKCCNRSFISVLVVESKYVCFPTKD